MHPFIFPHFCGIIPPHLLRRVGGDGHATLEQLRELARGAAASPIPVAAAGPVPTWKRRHVYDAGHQFRLPGKLSMSRHKARDPESAVLEAYDGFGATHDFFARLFRRNSIDGKGMRLDATVRYGERFQNAVWDGRQLICGDGDGRIFGRFTASLDAIAHLLTHGVTQHSAGLGSQDETGALNEHLSDAFGIMVRQYTLGQRAKDSDWVIGAELFGPAFAGSALRSFALPGSAYDHPLLGRDPQPSHMRDYVETAGDNGGIHVNSGILNHAFYLAAMAMGGHTWEVLGRIWYVALTDRLRPDADFADFTRATVDIAGELYGNGGHVQRLLADAWGDVGLPVPLFGCVEQHSPARRRRQLDAHRRRRQRGQLKKGERS
ncbi:MAG TPA: M4 family metallopeptidase [Thermoanaerobaculia bacterium]|nr:M4 family metallopeptidase [Thermoanaerobaculia bacterium]